MKAIYCLLLSIIISIFCLGKYVEANTESVTETNGLNNKRFEFLLQRLELVERRNDEIEKKMEKMAEDFRQKERTLNDRIAELENLNNIGNNDDDNDERVSDERPNDTIDDENVREETDGGDTMQKQRRTIKSGSRLKRSSGSQVAFFATATPHDVEHLGKNQNIVFDHAVTNVGNAYHNIHGIFTAPVAGTYVFTATVAGRHYAGGSDYYAHFDVNGQLVASFIALNQATQTIIVKLKAGDDVSVKNEQVDDSILGANFTSFSGFLLYQNSVSSAVITGK